MSGSNSFVDTNILLYAHDVSEPEKREHARSLIRQLWESGEPCISIQVLQEFFVNATRKIPKPLAPNKAAEVVADHSRWRVHSPVAEDVLAAIETHRQRDISFWDAMILQSASRLGCTVVYSEDLNSGQRFDGVEIHNPFVRD